MFERLMNEIWGTIADRIFRVELYKGPASSSPKASQLIYHHPKLEVGVRQEAAEVSKAAPAQTKQSKPQPIIRGKKPGRNDPCPCGSGKKYKKCCYPKYG